MAVVTKQVRQSYYALDSEDFLNQCVAACPFLEKVDAMTMRVNVPMDKSKWEFFHTGDNIPSGSNIDLSGWRACTSTGSDNPLIKFPLGNVSGSNGPFISVQSPVGPTWYGIFDRDMAGGGSYGNCTTTPATITGWNAWKWEQYSGMAQFQMTYDPNYTSGSDALVIELQTSAGVCWGRVRFVFDRNNPGASFYAPLTDSSDLMRRRNLLPLTTSTKLTIHLDHLVDDPVILSEVNEGVFIVTVNGVKGVVVDTDRWAGKVLKRNSSREWDYVESTNCAVPLLHRNPNASTRDDGLPENAADPTADGALYFDGWHWMSSMHYDPVNNALWTIGDPFGTEPIVNTGDPKYYSYDGSKFDTENNTVIPGPGGYFPYKTDVDNPNPQQKSDATIPETSYDGPVDPEQPAAPPVVTGTNPPVTPTPTDKSSLSDMDKQDQLIIGLVIAVLALGVLA